jgi:MoaA/NifB/PqqE/SkfB family radical SAM enzyme
LKIFAHPEKIKEIAENKQTAPIHVMVKPTNTCNHACYYCSYADDTLGLRDVVVKSDYIEWSKMEEIIRDLKDMGVKCVSFSGGGEPLTYK